MTHEKWMDEASVVRDIEYTFDVASQLTAVGDDDASIDFEYDGIGRLATRKVDIAGLNTSTMSNKDAKFESVYEASSLRMDKRLAYIGDTLDHTNDFTYDAENRISSITQSGTSVNNKFVGLSYNKAGQLTTVVRATDLNYDTSGTLVPSTHVATSFFGFDKRGRLTSIDHTDDASNSITGYVYGYDAADQLTSTTFTNASHSAESVGSFGYDGRGQLEGVVRTTGTDED